MICRLLDGIKKKAAYNRLVDIHHRLYVGGLKLLVTSSAIAILRYFAYVLNQVGNIS